MEITKHKGLPNKKERIESILKENPVAIAATQGWLREMKREKNWVVKVNPYLKVTALKDKSQPTLEKKVYLENLWINSRRKKKKKKKPKDQRNNPSQTQIFTKNNSVSVEGRGIKKRKCRT